MTVTYEEYSEMKKSFFAKHDNDFQTYTSSLDEYNRYYKDYCFSDGAVWYELMSPEWEVAEVEVKLVKFPVQVKLLRTEFFSTDDAQSRYYYEKY